LQTGFGRVLRLGRKFPVFKIQKQTRVQGCKKFEYYKDIGTGLDNIFMTRQHITVTDRFFGVKKLPSNVWCHRNSISKFCPAWINTENRPHTWIVEFFGILTEKLTR